MNLFNIIDEIEKFDPELNDRLNPRRAAIKNITSFGSKVAMAAVPFAMGTMLKKAYGAAAAPTVIEVLNYALTLEYLESSFYNTGAASVGLIPAARRLLYQRSKRRRKPTRGLPEISYYSFGRYAGYFAQV